MHNMFSLSELTEKGFKYTTNHNGENVALWISNDILDDKDIDSLVNEFEDFGFPVTKYDGLQGA